MKVIVIRSNLKEGLASLQGVLGTNQNLPILGHVLFEAKQSTIKISATNLEIAATIHVPGKVIEPGSCAVPFGSFFGIIQNLQSERLNISAASKNNIELATDNYHAVLSGLPTDDFPIIPAIKDRKQYLELEEETFRDALEQVSVSAQYTELRPELSAILFSFSIDAVKLVATDSFRLAEKTIPQGAFAATFSEPFKILVPLKAVHELVGALRGDGKVKLFRDENQACFSGERYEYVTRLVDGSFPDYEYLIPKTFRAEAIVEREECVRAVKLGSVLSGRVNEIALRVFDTKKAVEVRSADKAVGENTYLLPAKVRGDAHEATFNWRYLSDGLRALRGSEAFLGFPEENKPTLLRSPNDGSYFYILMPILKA